jgi:hypothetical protein
MNGGEYKGNSGNLWVSKKIKPEIQTQPFKSNCPAVSSLVLVVRSAKALTIRRERTPSAAAVKLSVARAVCASKPPSGRRSAMISVQIQFGEEVTKEWCLIEFQGEVKGVEHNTELGAIEIKEVRERRG